MSSSKVVIRDRGWNKLVATLKRIADEKPVAKVGFLASKTDSEVITIAIANEFGVPAKNIPERSFVRSTFDVKKQETYELLRELVGGIYQSEMTGKRALGIAGARLAADIKEYVTQGASVPPPNAPATIARKLGLHKAREKAMTKAARGVEKRAAIASAVFGDHGDRSEFDQVRQLAIGKVQGRAVRRVERRLQQAKMAAAVFGASGGVRTLVDTGRMIGSVTWSVVSRRDEG